MLFIYKNSETYFSFRWLKAARAAVQSGAEKMRESAESCEFRLRVNHVFPDKCVINFLVKISK